MEEQTKKFFGQNLIELRKKKGVTRRELAQELGINEGTLQGYETKGREPKFSMLIKIADFFSVSIDDLIRVKDITKVGAGATGAYISDQFEIDRTRGNVLNQMQQKLSPHLTMLDDYFHYLPADIPVAVTLKINARALSNVEERGKIKSHFESMQDAFDKEVIAAIAEYEEERKKTISNALAAGMARIFSSEKDD